MGLQELRRDADVSQAEVARRMAVSQSRVSAIEAAEIGTMELGTVTRYIRALGGEVLVQVTLPDGEVVRLG